MANPDPIDALGPRAQAVYEQLCSDIRRGVFPVNSRLPTENELCQRFGAGRHSVRRAMAQLAEEGLVVTRQGSGSVVCQPQSQGQDIISLMFAGQIRLLTDIQDLVLSHGCVMSVYSQLRDSWSPEGEADYLRKVQNQRHRALLALCSPTGSRREELLQGLVASGVRVIHMDNPYRDRLPTEEYLIPDYERAGYVAATSLLVGGCRQLIYCGMRSDGPFHDYARRGFIAAMHDHIGIDTLVDVHRADGERALWFDLPRLSEDPEARERVADMLAHVSYPVGIVCNAVQRADALQVELRALGVRVPEDVQLIGIDLLGSADEMMDITAMRFDWRAMYREAVDAVTTPGAAPIRRTVAPRLVHGLTTAGLPTA